MSPPLEYKDIINALEGKDGAYWQKMLMELTQKNKAATPSDVHEAVVHAKRLPLDLSTVIPDSQCIHLDEKFLAEYRSKHPEFRYGALGEVTYKRTYARTVNWITRKKENWFDTVKRVVEGTLYIQQCHCVRNDLEFDAEERLQNFGRPLFDSIFNFRMLPPGRGLWAMGTENVETKGFASLFNCAFISTERMGDPDYDIVTPFLFMMDMSMLGVGVGFDTKGSTKSLTIHRPKNRFYKLDDKGILRTIHHKVEDSREGWVNSLRAVLEAYLKPDHDLPRFDYEDVRPCGVPIKKFGGTTSGPVPLREMHDELIKVLDKFAGMTLTSDELFTEFGLKGVSLLSALILDIMNIIGNCVVSGNVRRSAQIAFGDPDDDRFRTLKDWRDPRNAYRAGYMYASNNSYLFEKRHTDKGVVYLSQKFLEVEESLLLNGEPGVMFLEAARAYGRMADAPNYKDAKACGSNPCVEQTLHDGELCNLVETFIAKMKDKSEFLRTLMLAFEFAKTVTLGSIHWKITDDIVAKNRRIGTSISGIIDFLDMFDMDVLKDWLDTGYQFLQFFDCWLSHRMHIPMSIKTTSIKPSGTVSLVAGASPGMHPPHSRFYIRHVRFSPDSELLKPLADAGYRIVWNIKGRNPDGTPILDYRSKVVAFPIDEGKHVKTTKENFSMKQQFELLVLIQKWWADNQVSVTITYDRKKEGHQIHKMLMEHYNEVKAVSFLENEKGTYDLMPYEEITEEQYLKEAANLKPVQWELVEPTTPQCMEDEETDNYCDGGACMISRKFTPPVAEAMEDVEDPGNMFCDGDSCQLPPRSAAAIDKKKRKRDNTAAGSQEEDDEISSDTESSSDEAASAPAAKRARK